MSTKNVKVVKFGGTSLIGPKKSYAKGFANAGDQIVSLVNDGWKVVCVLSAYAGATDELVKLSKQISGNPDPRAMDFILSTGEQVSVGLMAIYLRSKGVLCECMTGWQAGIITSSVFTKAAITKVDGAPIKEMLKSKDVVLITGFQGVTDSGEITTLGRGGSDTSAIALAVALEADDCEIRTDVQGIYTSKPQVVPGAKLLSILGFDEALEMASAGAKVIDPRAVELARIHNKEFTVRHHTISDSSTRVVSQEHAENSVVAVVQNDKCVLLVVDGVPNASGYTAKIIKCVCEFMVRVGFVFQSYTDTKDSSVVVLLWETDGQTLGAVVDKISGISDKIQARIDKGVACVSIVGRELLDRPGAAADCVKEFVDLGVPVLGISSSKIRMTFVVPSDHVDDVVRRMHDRFVGEE